MEISLLDYGVGNIKSITSAFEKSGSKIKLINDSENILKANALVIPGVGAFPEASKALGKNNLDSAIREFSRLNKPILGICLGMQLLFDSSLEFGETKGLGLIAGTVEPLKPSKNDFKLPHVNWNSLLPTKSKTSTWANTILEDISFGQEMYFVHSFVAKPKEDSHILSVTQYGGQEFCSTTKYNNIYGCQFHPEKSGFGGLKIIENFCQIVKNLTIS